MNTPLSNVLKVAASASVAAAFTQTTHAEDQPKKNQIKKAIMFGTVGVKGSILEKFKAIKEAGFGGVEPSSHMDVNEVLKARDKTGLEIPSVCCGTHWKENLASPNPAERARGLDGLRQSLQDAKKYGASSVLFISAVVNKEVSYADAYTRSQQEVRKAIPLAEELGVKIAIENVWNNFLLSPMEAARYVDEFNSPAIGWHFDIGNVLRYGWPEQWIPVLGSRIQKLHIKEYSRDKMESGGLWKGFDVPLLEGSNNWPKIVKALRQINYNGWAITEQGGGGTMEGLKNLSERLDKILAS